MRNYSKMEGKSMKKMSVALLCLLMLVFSGCGSLQGSSNVTPEATAPSDATETYSDAADARTIVQSWLSAHPNMVGFNLNEYDYDMFEYGGEEYYRFYSEQQYWLDFLVHRKTGEILCRQTEDGEEPRPPVVEPLDDYYERVFR